MDLTNHLTQGFSFASSVVLGHVQTPRGLLDRPEFVNCSASMTLVSSGLATGIETGFKPPPLLVE